MTPEELKAATATVDALRKVMKESGGRYVHNDTIKEITGKDAGEFGLDIDGDNEVDFGDLKDVFKEHLSKIDNFQPNEKIDAFKEFGMRDIHSSEPNDRAKTMDLLLANTDGNYIYKDKILVVTGKTAEELELELDNDDEISTNDLKMIVDANTKTVTKFQHFLDNEATDQDYIDIMSYKYDIDAQGRTARKSLLQSKLNTPKNNLASLKAMDHSLSNNMKPHVLNDFKLDWEGFSHVIEDVDRDDSDIMLKNPSFKEEHAIKMVDQFPDIAARHIQHKTFRGAAKDSFFKKDDNWQSLTKYQIDNIVRENARDQHPDRQFFNNEEDKLSPDFANKILRNVITALDGGNFDLVMGSLNEDTRNNFFNENLGITGGEHNHTLPNEEGFEDNNWDNWTNGASDAFMNGYDSRVANQIASSRHLTDDQADHIKRHGSFKEKYSLYQNKHVDVKHGKEMYQKWAENHDTHGYDSDEIREAHQYMGSYEYGWDDLTDEQQSEIEVSDRFYEYTDEAAIHTYTIDSYMDDNEDKIIEQMGDRFDDKEEIYDQLVSSGDWEGENPDAKQNIGNPLYDNLDKLNQENNLDRYSFTVDELKDDHNINIKDYGIKPDEDGNVDGEDLLAELNKFGGPSKIDFSYHEEHGIEDHPDYKERSTEVLDEYRRELLNGDRRWEISDELYLYDDHRESEGYQDAQSEAGEEFRNDTSNYQEEIDSLHENSHTDDRLIPEHISSQMPELEETRKQRKKEKLSSELSALELNETHSYGENQHSHELLLDHANANDGKIDVGTMHKKFPNLKDTWKKIFNGKGKLDSGEIQGKIDEIPKTNYDISYGEWKKDKMQNVNGRNQIIVRLDHSDESLKQIHDHEDPNVKTMFDRVQKVSKQSGHPTRDRTVGWIRLDTSDPAHWFIDEVQSDFGKTVTQYLKDQGEGEKVGAINSIYDIHKDWRETLTNQVLKMAKNNGVSKVSTHSPESKHAHAAYGGSNVHSVYKDSYKKVPRKMGFVESAADSLPLTEKGMKNFKTKTEDKEKGDVAEHRDAYEHHMDNHNLFTHMAGADGGDYANPELREKTKNFALSHKKMAENHKNKILSAGFDLGTMDIDIEFDDNQTMSGDQYLSDNLNISAHDADEKIDIPMGKPAQDVEFKGHTIDLTPESMKKSIELIIDLIKSEENFVKMLKNRKIDNKLLLKIREMRKSLCC